MTALSKLKLVLVATTVLMVSDNISNGQTSSERSAEEKSAIAKPAADPSAKADPDMAKVLTVLNRLGPKPIETLTPAEARKQYTVADAVKKVIKDERLDFDPHKGLKISNSHFADMGKLSLRYYTPENTNKDSNIPVVVYFRGDGWVIADLNTYDATPSALARKANAIVVSVDYPMAPEHKFPAAHDEAIEAYKYIVKHAKRWGGNADRIGLVGESAGGNLALATAIAARDQKITVPVAIISIYPVATTTWIPPQKKKMPPQNHSIRP